MRKAWVLVLVMLIVAAAAVWRLYFHFPRPEEDVVTQSGTLDLAVYHVDGRLQEAVLWLASKNPIGFRVAASDFHYAGFDQASFKTQGKPGAAVIMTVRRTDWESALPKSKVPVLNVSLGGIHYDTREAARQRLARYRPLALAGAILLTALAGRFGWMLRRHRPTKAANSWVEQRPLNVAIRHDYFAATTGSLLPLAMLLAAILVVIFTLLMARSAPDLDAIPICVFLLSVVAAPFLLTDLFQRLSRPELRFADGVARRFRFGREAAALPYAEIEEMTYQVGQDAFFRYFTLEIRSAGQAIRLTCRTDDEDFHPIEVVCLHLADQLADRWQARLAAGETIPWTGDYRLTQDGIERVKTGERIAWSALDWASVEEPSCYLWQGNAWQSLPTDEANFWPIYHLVCRRLKAQRRPPEKCSAVGVPANLARLPRIVIGFHWNLDDYVARRLYVEYQPRNWRGSIRDLLILLLGNLLLILPLWLMDLWKWVWITLVIAEIGLLLLTLHFIYLLATVPGRTRRWWREQVAAEWRRWRQGGDEDPIPELVYTLTPLGCLTQSHAGEGWLAWKNTARVDRYQDWIMLPSKDNPNIVELIIPARALSGPEAALSLYHTIRRWHAECVDRVAPTELASSGVAECEMKD